MAMSSLSPIEETLLGLLRIPSETENESALAATVQEMIRATAHGRFSIRRHENNLVIEPLARQGEPPPYLLVGHLDTVPAWEGHTVVVHPDRIEGVGATDMKSGVAVLLALLADEKFPVGAAAPSVILYCGEEGPYRKNGLHTVLSKEPHLCRAPLAFILEPTNNEVQVGCLGIVGADLVVRGKRAHAARPWEGVNALYRAAPLLQRIAQYPHRTVQIAGLPFTELLSATQARTGDNAANVLPDTFTVRIELRYAPDRTPEEACALFHSVIGDEAELTIDDVTPAGIVPEKNAVLDQFQLQWNLPVSPKQAYTDVALFAAYGVPAVNCGPGAPAQAHQRGESVPRAALQRSLEIFQGFVRGLASA